MFVYGADSLLVKECVVLMVPGTRISKTTYLKGKGPDDGMQRNGANIEIDLGLGNGS